MKIKEGGGMDIKESKELSFDTQDFPKEVWVFDADNLDQGTEISHLMMSHAEQYTKDELLEICRQASMVIDQLRAELAKTQAVPEWISVKDSLPPENILVLGMSQTRSNIFNVYNVMALDEFEEAEVTHWMPLPDAPQEPDND